MAGLLVSVKSRLRKFENGRMQRITEMIFYRPDGVNWMDKHKVIESTNEHETTSFGFEKGDWVKRRSYVWKLKNSGAGNK